MSTPALTFDDALHAYYLDGQRLLSVTQILERTGIVDYSYIPPRTREMALERGRAVHEAIALDLEGDLDEASVEPIMGYIAASRSAMRDLGIIQPDAWECRGYHPAHLYAGTFDVLADKVLLDWKTNSAEWWVRLQLAAYAAIQGGGASITRIACELHQDGSYRLITFPAKDYRRDFADFLAALRVVQMIDEHDSRKRKAA